MPTTERTPHPGETNGLHDPRAYHDTVTAQIARRVDWTTPGLRITRLRLISDRGWPTWDVSYCHGDLNGEPVDVALPFDVLPKGRVSAVIIEHAKASGVYAKGLGILDAISTLH